MTTLLTTPYVTSTYGGRIERVAEATAASIDTVLLDVDPAVRLSADVLESIDIAFFSSDIFPDYGRAFFAAAESAPNLQWVQLFNVGTDNAIFQGLLAKGVRMSSAAGASADPIAQNAIGGMLALSRGFVPLYRRAQIARRWESIPDLGPDLCGQKMTIVGLGAIGNTIARIATAIGMEVTGIRRSPGRNGDHASTVLPPDRLNDVLPTTDWLMLTCPLTEETRGLIGAAELAALPRGAGLVNVGRGKVVQERALTDALANGHLGAAYLDVFETEPLPSHSPLWTMPNVIITPHASSASTLYEGRVIDLFIDNLTRWVSGLPLLNEVAGPAPA